MLNGISGHHLNEFVSLTQMVQKYWETWTLHVKFSVRKTDFTKYLKNMESLYPESKLWQCRHQQKVTLLLHLVSKWSKAMHSGLGNIKSRDLSIGYDSRSGVNTKKAATLTEVWGCQAIAEFGGWLVWRGWRSMGTADMARLICEEFAVLGRLSPSPLSFSISDEAGTWVHTA